MKFLAKKSKKWWVTLGVLLSVPTVMWAYLWQDYIDVSYHLKVGSGNWSSANEGSLLVGYGNGAYFDNSAAVGSYLTTFRENSLVVGSWNKQNYPNPNPLFTVANGTEDLYTPGIFHPKNIFEVYGDGTILMSDQQGDISMGVYGD